MLWLVSDRRGIWQAANSFGSSNRTHRLHASGDSGHRASESGCRSVTIPTRCSGHAMSSGPSAYRSPTFGPLSALIEVTAPMIGPASMSHSTLPKPFRSVHCPCCPSAACSNKADPPVFSRMAAGGAAWPTEPRRSPHRSPIHGTRSERPSARGDSLPRPRPLSQFYDVQPHPQAATAGIFNGRLVLQSSDPRDASTGHATHRVTLPA